MIGQTIHARHDQPPASGTSLKGGEAIAFPARWHNQHIDGGHRFDRVNIPMEGNAIIALSEGFQSLPFRTLTIQIQPGVHFRQGNKGLNQCVEALLLVQATNGPYPDRGTGDRRIHFQERCHVDRRGYHLKPLCRDKVLRDKPAALRLTDGNDLVKPCVGRAQQGGEPAMILNL